MAKEVLVGMGKKDSEKKSKALKNVPKFISVSELTDAMVEEKKVSEKEGGKILGVEDKTLDIVEVLRMHDDVILPEYQTEGSSGMDIRAYFKSVTDLKQLNQDTHPIEVTVNGAIMLPSGSRVIIPSGLKISMPIGMEAQVRSRSGLSLKKGLVVSQGIGTIDSDYRGEIGICITNIGKSKQYILKGERICQLVFAKVEKIQLAEIDQLSSTERGEGGFGSTGEK